MWLYIKLQNLCTDRARERERANESVFTWNIKRLCQGSEMKMPTKPSLLSHFGLGVVHSPYQTTRVSGRYAEVVVRLVHETTY